MYEYESVVGFSKVDENLELSLDGVIDYLQDAAIYDSENGNATVERLYSEHMAWLLASWQVEIDHMPKMSEKIYVSTYPYEFKGFFGYRNFMIKNAAGDVLIKAAAIWTLIDTQDLKPIRITPELLECYTIGEKLDMEYKPRKIKLIGEGVKKEGIRIRKSQIDSNRHLNNCEYVSMIMDYLLEERIISELRVEYRNAVYLGETVYPVVYEVDENMIQISIVGEQDEVKAICEVTYK